MNRIKQLNSVEYFNISGLQWTFGILTISFYPMAFQFVWLLDLWPDQTEADIDPGVQAHICVKSSYIPRLYNVCN